MSDDTCEWPRCNAAYDLIFYGKKICDYHWTEFLGSENDRRAASARAKVGLPRKLPKTEWSPPKIDPSTVIIERSTSGNCHKKTPSVVEDAEGQEPDTSPKENSEEETNLIPDLLSRIRNNIAGNCDFD